MPSLYDVGAYFHGLNRPSAPFLLGAFISSPTRQTCDSDQNLIMIHSTRPHTGTDGALLAEGFPLSATRLPPETNDVVSVIRTREDRASH